MATGLYIDARQLTKGAKAFERLIKEFPDHVSDVLKASAEEIVRVAKDNAPVDRGDVKGGLRFTNTKPLQKKITSRAPHSAWIEFGTGKHAAMQVAKYPEEYQAYAAQFKGTTSSGNFDDMVKLIAAWIHRRGLGTGFKGTIGVVGTYSIKTRRRTGNKATQEKQNLQAAYVIAISILRKGVHPHPFLIPAVIDQQKDLIRDMTTLLNKLKIV